MKRWVLIAGVLVGLVVGTGLLAWRNADRGSFYRELSLINLTGQDQPEDVAKRLREAGAVLRYDKGHVVGITFGWPYVDNRHFAHLLTFPRLRQIDFNACPYVDDDTLRILARLKEIEELNLGGTRITDTSLELLARLPRLKKLYLWRTKLTDAGMKTLARMKRLEHLNLWDAPIGDAGLLHLAESRSLKRLGIGQSIQPGDERDPALEVRSVQLSQAAIDKFQEKSKCQLFYWKRSDGPPSAGQGLLSKRRFNPAAGGLRPQRSQRLPPDLGKRRQGSDWSSFLGPQGDGKSSERGLQIPGDEGYSIVWQRRTHEGYGTCAVSRGRLFFLERQKSTMRLVCLQAETGEELWVHESPTTYEDQLGYGNGPRCSPVVDGERVYAYGADGQLYCVHAVTGKTIWHVDTFKQFGVVQYFFGVGSTPVIYHDLLIAVVGGSPSEQRKKGRYNLDDLSGNGSGIVAFNKFNGQVVYSITDALASYASPKLTKINGRDWCWAFVREGLIGFEPATGRASFVFPWRAKFRAGVNAATPVVSQNEVFITEAYGPGCAKIQWDGSKQQVAWRDPPKSRKKRLHSHWATPILHKGFLYGCAGRHTSDAELRCVDWKSGKVVWQEELKGLSSLIFVDDHLITLDEYGRLDVLRVSSLGYLSRYSADLSEVYRDGRPLLSYPVWSAPVVSHGLLYLRGKERLVCLEVIPQVPAK